MRKTKCKGKSESRRTRRKGKREKRRRDFCTFLSHTCMCARIPTAMLFFAVTSVTQREENRSKFDRKVRKFGEIEEKTTRKNVFFSVVQSPFWTIILSVC